VRDNREKALLSHCFTKAMVQGRVDANPCRGVQRNRERSRERKIKRRLQKCKRLAPSTFDEPRQAIPARRSITRK
jgi:hypothetical protein